MNFKLLPLTAWSFGVFLLVAMNGLGAVADQKPCRDVSKHSVCRQKIEVANDAHIEILGNFRLGSRHEHITSAVILLQGHDRQFERIYSAMTALYRDSPNAMTTMIIAPHFEAEADHPAADYLRWSSEGWPNGDASLNHPRLSSFEVMDHLVGELADPELFPHLKKIRIIGFSAGGQFVQRYAAGTVIDRDYSAVQLKYFVASPGSYLYFNEWRKTLDQGPQIESPVELANQGVSFSIPAHAACAWNDYKYGLLDRNSYMSRMSSDRIIKNYFSKEIVYLVGEQDNATAHPPDSHPEEAINDIKAAAVLDVSCPAEYQGVSRYERALVFNHYLNLFFPLGGVSRQHQLIVGPGIAHELRLFEVPEARLELDLPGEASDQNPGAS